MKSALFYALNAGSFDVIAVTSEKARGRWFGRRIHDDSTTHGSYGLYGRFDTPEAAQAKRAAVKAVEQRFEELRKPVQSELRKLYADEQVAIKAALSNA